MASATGHGLRPLLLPLQAWPCGVVRGVVVVSTEPCEAMRGHARPCEATRGQAGPWWAVPGGMWGGFCGCGCLYLSPARKSCHSVLLGRLKSCHHDTDFSIYFLSRSGLTPVRDKNYLEKCFSMVHTGLLRIECLPRPHPLDTARRLRASAVQALPPGTARVACRMLPWARRLRPPLLVPAALSVCPADFSLPHDPIGG